MSLWSISDAATAQLMDDLYRYALRRRRPLDPVAALRTAQLESLDRYRNLYGEGRPWEWGAFIMSGD